MVTRKKDATSAKKASRQRKEFTMHPDWLFDSRLSLAACYVYVVLLSHLPYDSPDTGTVWPAVRTIATKAKISERAVYNALYELRDVGLISIGKRLEDANRNEYVIHALSRAQIEALCRGGDETAAPLLAADTGLHEVQTRTREVAPGADPRLHHVQVEVAPRAKEVDTRTRTRGTRRGWDGAPASGESTARVPSLESFGEDDHPPSSDRPHVGARNLGYNDPLPDPADEASAVDVVNRVNLLAVRRGRNPVTGGHRRHWLKSSRILLSRHPVEEVARLIDWAGDDGYWGGRIVTVFALSENYDALLRDSLGRDPRPRDSRSGPVLDPGVAAANARYFEANPGGPAFGMLKDIL